MSATPAMAITVICKRLFIINDELQGIHEADSVSSNFSPIFPQYTIFEEKPSYNTENPTCPSGSEVITEMNERYVFFQLAWTR